MANSSKMKLLRVLDILKETDEAHPYTANRIVHQLSLYGIEAEKKSVLRDIATLQDYGYDILLHADNKLGYYLASREFEDWELKVLMDAVVGASFLTEENSRLLAEKISTLSSLDGRKLLREATPVPTYAKIGNPTTKNAIDLLLKAIRQKRTVQFQYVRMGEDLKYHLQNHGRMYPVSPYALIWRQDKYYLIGVYGHYQKLSYYRLDRIRNLKITDMPITPMESILGPNADLCLKEYVNQNIYNHGGTAVRVKLKAIPEAADLLVETFGENVQVKPQKDGSLIATAKVSDGDGLILWLIQHGDWVQIIEPETIRQEVIQALDEIRARYLDEPPME